MGHILTKLTFLGCVLLNQIDDLVLQLRRRREVEGEHERLVEGPLNDSIEVTDYWRVIDVLRHHLHLRTIASHLNLILGQHRQEIGIPTYRFGITFVIHHSLYKLRLEVPHQIIYQVVLSYIQEI